MYLVVFFAYLATTYDEVYGTRLWVSRCNNEYIVG